MLAKRWQSVNRAFYQDIGLPPVVLYKVGQVYFGLSRPPLPWPSTTRS
jgi:hypothetical protein